MPATSPLLIAVLLVVYLPPAAVLAWHDGRSHRLPNRWVAVLSLAVAAALTLLAALVPSLRSGLWSAGVLAVVLGAVAIVLGLVAPALLGMGDAKTVPVVVLMTAALGGEVLLAGLLGAALLAGLLGTAVMLVARRTGVRFAVGPVLLATPFLGLLGGPLVASALGTA